MLLCSELERVMEAGLVLTSWAAWPKEKALCSLAGRATRSLHQTPSVSSTSYSRFLFSILLPSLLFLLCAFTLVLSKLPQLKPLHALPEVSIHFSEARGKATTLHFKCLSQAQEVYRGVPFAALTLLM